MNKNRCFIVGAGEFSCRVLPSKHDYIIAADGGYSELIARGITPDIVIGDFDSLGHVPEHPNIAQYQADKDDTDMMLAVKHGLAKGCSIFVIDGGLGGRLDHTLANIQILAHIAQSGARGYLIGRDICVTAVKDGAVRFAPGLSSRISVFCAGDKAEGVMLDGLKYPLDGATLTCDYPVGVSNEFTGAPATVAVRSGTLIITWAGGLETIDLDGI